MKTCTLPHRFWCVLPMDARLPSSPCGSVALPANQPAGKRFPIARCLFAGVMVTSLALADGAPDAGGETNTVPTAIRIYQNPASAGKPNREKRVLVLGVGSDLTKTFVEANQRYKGYDIIVGTDIEGTSIGKKVLNTLTPDPSMAGTTVGVSEANALAADVSPELARRKYSEPILRELRRIADPHGQDSLDFAQIDIHSKGLLAVSSLLCNGSIAATNVTAYGPAVGNDFWALDNLSAYAADRPLGSVSVKCNPNDPVPRATPLQAGTGAVLAEHVKAQHSRVNVVPVAMPGVEGIAGHYLENYLLFANMSPEELARRRAAVSGSQKSNWLLGVVFKLEGLREKAIQDIRKYEGEIQKCNGTIAKSDDLVRQAQQKGNAKVEAVAQEAVRRAQEARTRNTELKASAERRKQRAEYALAHTRNALADATGSPCAWRSNGGAGVTARGKGSGRVSGFMSLQETP